MIKANPTSCPVSRRLVHNTRFNLLLNASNYRQKKSFVLPTLTKSTSRSLGFLNSPKMLLNSRTVQKAGPYGMALLVYFYYSFIFFSHSIYCQVSVTQSISGTGALRIGAAFVARHYPHSKIIYVPTPTWGNHIPVFRDSGLEVRHYKYFNKDTVGLDFEGFKADLKVPNLTLVCEYLINYQTYRPPLSILSYCFMHALTTPLESILLKLSGEKFPTSQRRRSYSHSLTWRIKALPLALPPRTHLRSVTSCRRAIKSLFVSPLPKTWASMANVLERSP
jgi:hypothetical protein